MNMSLKLFLIFLIFASLWGQAFAQQDMTLRLHCWEGYAKPYVTGFKKIIKNKYNMDIKLEITNASDPAEFWEKARFKNADIISPAHNILRSKRWKFIEGGVALPLELGNVPNYSYLLGVLKKNDFATVENQVYGIPYTMGPYGLAFNSEKVEEPKSWSVLWDKKNKGLYTISKDYSDCNIYTSALVLGASYDDLYDIDKLLALFPKNTLQKKLNAMAANAGSLWIGTADPDELKNLSYATTWGYAVARVNKKGGKWKMTNPKEGTTMWVDHWSITYRVKNNPLKKKLCEEWINYCLSPDLQVGVIRNWGVSPVVTNVNDLLTDEEIQTFRVGDNEYWETLSFWENQNARTTNIYKMLWNKALLLSE